ncbi:MAG: hypothetical protein H7839_24570 [Magnetococcus sp. YQC-5]
MIATRAFAVARRDEQEDILFVRFNEEPVERDISCGWDVNVGLTAERIGQMTILDAKADGLLPLRLPKTVFADVHGSLLSGGIPLGEPARILDFIQVETRQKSLKEIVIQWVADGTPSLNRTLVRSIIFLNDSLVVAQSTTSTFQGKSDSTKSSSKSLITSKPSGWSEITHKSRSEYSLAVHLTREPNARTSWLGTCFWRIS